MADNVQFHNDGAVEGHIGEAIGFYEADKGMVHLYAPGAGHRSIVAANAGDAERIFWDFVNEMKKFAKPAMNEPWL